MAVVTVSHASLTLAGGNLVPLPFVYLTLAQLAVPFASTSPLVAGSAYLPFVVVPLFWIGGQKVAVPGPPVPEGAGTNALERRASERLA